MQREIAYRIIYKTLNDESYTNLLMRSELNKLPKIQRGYVTYLVNGVLKNYDFLVYQTKDLYIKTSKSNEVILAMAIYEKFFMKKEDYVINNEYVKLAKDEYASKFINAILHKILSLKEPKEEHTKHSLPLWLYNLLAKQYNKEELKIIIGNYDKFSTTYYRLNPNKCSFKDIENLNINIIDDLTFTANENLFDSLEFNNGYFYVQDINASKLVKELNLSKDDIFLDACSAPGSKLFNALEVVKDINAYANDVNEKRVNLISKKAELLGYKNIHYTCLDASTLSKNLDISFDKILLDVPCSGLGVIARRNDIKFHIKPEDLDELVNVQKEILFDVSKLLKVNGLLLYSTCTLNKKENTRQVNSFIENNSNYKLIKEETILNEIGDMFYYALIQRLS